MQSEIRQGKECQRPTLKHNGRCELHGGKFTKAKNPEGLRRTSEANLKYGCYTKDKLAVQIKRGEVRQKLNAE